ncbi:MAG: prolyl oligopeptidase family serine peptidase [Clostridia bacterium]|nr:prolyl oligopeptidase family serine peptidase [Clostridia bacterium]
MEKIITYETLRNFAYSNDKIVKRPIKGVVLSFFGLGGMTMYSVDTVEGRYFAESGILYVVPYTNPWAWMNWQTVCYTDEILDVLFEHYELPDDLPVVSTGGSMGGQSALVYMVYAQRTPIACVANCPVCDLLYHYTERPDLPRTLYSAFWNEEGGVADVLKTASPIHLVDKMPDAEYYIFHCTEDKAVNKQQHSDRFVELLEEKRNVDYIEVPDRGHCDLPENMRELYLSLARDAILFKD